ncbi:MAG: diguanylate cyclase [Desulfitobacterium sp.]
MRYAVKKGFHNPFFCLENNNVIKVSEDLIKMTQYTEGELLGRTFDSLCNLLKVDKKINLKKLETKQTYYIFTKDLEPREVSVFGRSDFQNEQKYDMKEVLNSRLKIRLLYAQALVEANKLGTIILSYPELIVLNTNQKFLDLLHSPYREKQFSIGRMYLDILPNGYSERIEKIIIEAIEKKQTFISEMLEFTSGGGEKKYYDASYVPIFINGKAKYIVNTVVDVTEQVNAKKKIEEKNRLLSAIIENISDAVLIFDKEGKPIVLNKNITQEFPDESLNEVDDLRKYHKYYDEEGKEIAPEDIPIKRALRGERIEKGIMTVEVDDRKSTVQYNAIPIYDINHDILAGAVFINDITNLSILEESATKDFITGLNNSRSFDSYYNNCLRTSLEENGRFSILMFDIDYFKRVNDTHGHLAGNIVLKEFGKIVLASCRDFDFVSRVGGEEFSVILKQCSLAKTIEVAERIRKNVEDHDFVIENGKIIHITVSIGVAVYPDTVNNVHEVAESADKALYKAKQSGRNRIYLDTNP